MSIICAILCFMISLLNVASSNVPVLLWESSKSNRITKFPAMYPIPNSEFGQYIWKKGRVDATVAMFVGNTLSIEDFRDQEGQPVYPELKYIAQNSPNSEFMASVQNPVVAVEDLTKDGYTLHHVNIDKHDKINGGCGKVMIVKLQEAKPDEGRDELLRRHDGKIAEIYSQLLSKCSHVIGLLCGQQSSWFDAAEVTRVRRSTGDNMENNTSQLDQNFIPYEDKAGNVLLVTKSTPMIVSKGKNVTLEFNPPKTLPIITADRSKPSVIKLVMNFQTMNVILHFENQTGYWYMRPVIITGWPDNETQTLIPNKEIYAPLGMSYHSGSPVIFKNENVTLTFNDLQVQPFFTNAGSNKFGDAVDDVMFFTPPIWSGIFVTFLLAIIFTWGISMIMDIRTMDQFDDPKGKTITVSATD